MVQVASAPTSLCSCSARVGRGTTDVKKPALDVQRRRRGQFPAGEKRPIVGLARPATALRQGSHPPTQPSPAAQAPPSPSGRGTWFVSGLEKMALAGRQPEAVGLTRGQANVSSVEPRAEPTGFTSTEVARAREDGPGFPRRWLLCASSLAVCSRESSVVQFLREVTMGSPGHSGRGAPASRVCGGGVA